MSAITKLRAARDLAMHLFGRPRGFVVPYAYAASVNAVAEPYPEVEALLAASDWQSFLDAMAADLPDYREFGRSSSDPCWTSNMFGPLDGCAAYTAVKQLRPKRILEIGSGDSTRFLARATDPSSITCIDPMPRRSISELGVRFEKRMLDGSDGQRCEELEANDILFIDSSHIMLPGMDVDIEFNRIFPRLKAGVIVHVHDIFLPDDYPVSWRNRHYSEQNALIGWLISGYFDIIFPGYYVISRHADAVAKKLGSFEPARCRTAGSLWLRRAAPATARNQSPATAYSEASPPA